MPTPGPWWPEVNWQRITDAVPSTAFIALVAGFITKLRAGAARRRRERQDVLERDAQLASESKENAAARVERVNAWQTERLQREIERVEAECNQARFDREFWQQCATDWRERARDLKHDLQDAMQRADALAVSRQLPPLEWQPVADLPALADIKRPA